MVNEDSLATILLVGRLREEPVEPLKASEFWSLCNRVAKPSALLGLGVEQLAAEHGLAGDLAVRIATLLDRAMGMALELEHLDQTGISTLTPFEDHYPRRFIDLLGATAPALLYAAGAVESLDEPGVGVVGSRDVSPEGADLAAAAAKLTARLGLPVVSGGARGIDQTAMNAAFQAGGSVVGVLAESLARKLRSADVRRAIYEGCTVMCTPYSPEAPFSVGNAMGRNKLIYALSDLTLVVAADVGTGGTWAGATETLKRGFGRVAVWRGAGEGPGNALLEDRGAVPITSLDELQATVLGRARPASGETRRAEPVSPTPQPALFD
ncbi:MAG: DNA-processing protein DprA [bacterium]|nr:DNA-processing protein DprA [bacterium]